MRYRGWDLRTNRHIEIYLKEDVRTESGSIEHEFVAHHFSVQQSILMTLDFVRSLGQIMTTDEAKDLKMDLLKAMDGPGFDRGIEPAVNPLKIHQV